MLLKNFFFAERENRKGFVSETSGESAAEREAVSELRLSQLPQEEVHFASSSLSCSRETREVKNPQARSVGGTGYLFPMGGKGDDLAGMLARWLVEVSKVGGQVSVNWSETKGRR
jgi:hypothetical protein